jgi:hypothetical protein
MASGAALIVDPEVLDQVKPLHRFMRGTNQRVKIGKVSSGLTLHEARQFRYIKGEVAQRSRTRIWKETNHEDPALVAVKLWR